MQKGLMRVLFLVTLIGLLYAFLFPFTIFSFRKPLFHAKLHGLKQTEIYLEKGETTFIQAHGWNHRLFCYSTDFKVAGVSLFGKVYAKKVGTTVIKVRMNHKTYKCLVHVVQKKKRNSD